MARKPPVPACSEKDRRTLETWAHSRTEETRLVERARMIIGCLEGKPVSLIAQDLKTRPNTVIEWRHRFEKEGIKALHDRPRSGKPSRYGADFRKQVLEVLEQPAPSGQATWDGRAVAERLKSSDFATGAGPFEAASDDFNQDGQPDLAVVNYSSNTVSVLIGEGVGAFLPKTDYAVGTNPVSVAIGDLNGDGLPDLVVSNFSSGNVSVLLGNGVGVGPKTDYPALT